MDTLVVLVSVGLLVSLSLAVWFAIEYLKEQQLYYIAKSVILRYRRQYTGINRFVVTEPLLRAACENECESRIPSSRMRKIWVKLIEEGSIVQDPLDGEWTIKPDPELRVDPSSTMQQWRRLS